MSDYSDKYGTTTDVHIQRGKKEPSDSKWMIT